MHNILQHRVFRVHTKDGDDILTLPGLLASLIRNDIISLDFVRAHQRHPVHAFLVQLGAIAMYKAGLSELPDNAETWTHMLEALTPKYPKDEPWQLVVGDITKPAFLQPPSTTADQLRRYRQRSHTPDNLDVLVTATNHDQKQNIALRARPDDWIASLITLQTSAGFTGNGLYQISRMFAGFGSRSAMSIAPANDMPGLHIYRDIMALTQMRQRILDNYPMTDEGIALLWTVPWEGSKDEMLSLSELDPFYIEVCRRVRLVSQNGTLYALRSSTRGMRVDAKSLNGVVGDPWMPINIKRKVSLNVSKAGFNYSRMAEYLFSDDWERPLLFEPTRQEIEGELPCHLVARGLARGQGETRGYHERRIPIDPIVLAAISTDKGRRTLGTMATERVQLVADIKRILEHAISVFLSVGGTESRRLTRRWSSDLESTVDAWFFSSLQAEFRMLSDGQAERDRWLRDDVIRSARRILNQALESLPCSSSRRYGATVESINLFEGRLRGPSSPVRYLYEEELAGGNTAAD